MSVLAADALSVSAATGTRILREVSCSVRSGETVLVCGGPGSGKTILVKALLGLFEDRTDLEVSGRVTRPDRIGFVFQRPAVQLVRRVVRRDVAFGLENLGVPRDEIEARITDHATALDASHLLDRSVHELSQGETTLVALLGVLVTEPDVLVLDEPLAALDHPNTALVLDAIDRLRAADATVVIVEHDARDLLTRTDRVLLLEDGRVHTEGPPRAVAQDLYRAGIKLPYNTEIAAERAGNSDAPLPLSMSDETA